jgi:hypothetical protein
LKEGPTILPSASFTLEKASMTWKRSFLAVMFHAAECFVLDEANCAQVREAYSTVQ